MSAGSRPASSVTRWHWPLADAQATSSSVGVMPGEAR